MSPSALQRCVGDVDRFFDAHWARRPLLVAGADDDAFGELASLDDIDEMIASLALRESSLRMVEDGATLSPSAYTIAPSAKSRGAERIINAALVYERFYDGATIALEGLHRYWRPLADFCRELEMELGHRLQVNAYITPPGSRGFDVHRDDHDVFVLQLSGAKHWLVYDQGSGDDVIVDSTLRPGDSLYIPKGWPHAAATNDGASAHLTVGVLTHDSIDVLREIAKLAEEEPAFQERLDASRTKDLEGLSDLVERHVEELRTWLDKLDVEELTDRVARRVLSSSQPILRGQLTQLDRLAQIDADTRLARRRGSICVVNPKGDVVKVILIDRELTMPALAGDALQHISRHESFLVRDLHRFLDADSALVLARRLVREGLLEGVLD